MAKNMQHQVSLHQKMAVVRSIFVLNTNLHYHNGIRSEQIAYRLNALISKIFFAPSLHQYLGGGGYNRNI